MIGQCRRGHPDVATPVIISERSVINVEQDFPLKSKGCKVDLITLCQHSQIPAESRINTLNVAGNWSM